MDERIDSLSSKKSELRLDGPIIATDADGRIYWTNRAFRRLCGYSKLEVFGRRPDEFLRGEDTDPEALEAIRSALQNGESLNVEVLNYHKKGQPYRVSIALNPTRADDGRLTGFIAMEKPVVPKSDGMRICPQNQLRQQPSYRARKRRGRRANTELYGELM